MEKTNIQNRVWKFNSNKVEPTLLSRTVTLCVQVKSKQSIRSDISPDALNRISDIIHQTRLSMSRGDVTLLKMLYPNGSGIFWTMAPSSWNSASFVAITPHFMQKKGIYLALSTSLSTAGVAVHNPRSESSLSPDSGWAFWLWF